MQIVLKNVWAIRIQGQNFVFNFAFYDSLDNFE